MKPAETNPPTLVFNIQCDLKFGGAPSCDGVRRRINDLESDVTMNFDYG